MFNNLEPLILSVCCLDLQGLGSEHDYIITLCSTDSSEPSCSCSVDDQLITDVSTRSLNETFNTLNNKLNKKLPELTGTKTLNLICFCFFNSVKFIRSEEKHKV